MSISQAVVHGVHEWSMCVKMLSAGKARRTKQNVTELTHHVPGESARRERDRLAAGV